MDPLEFVGIPIHFQANSSPHFPLTKISILHNTPVISLYSHSTVAGGLDEISYATLLIPLTSLMILLEMVSMRS